MIFTSLWSLWPQQVLAARCPNYRRSYYTTIILFLQAFVNTPLKVIFSKTVKNLKMSTCRKTHAWQCCADNKFVCPHCVQPNAWRNFLRKNITEKRRRATIFLWKSFEKNNRSPCRPSAWAKAQKGEECRNLQNFISFYWFLPPLLHLSTQLCTFCLQNTVFCAIKKYKIR